MWSQVGHHFGPLWLALPGHSEGPYRVVHPRERIICTNSHFPLVKDCPIKRSLFYRLCMHECWEPTLECHRCPRTESKRYLVQLMSVYIFSGLIDTAMTGVKREYKVGHRCCICTLILLTLSTRILPLCIWDNKVFENKAHVTSFFPLMLVLMGCCDRVPHTGGLKITYIYSLRALEAESLNQGVQPGWLLEIWREILLNASFPRCYWLLSFIAFLGLKLPHSSLCHHCYMEFSLCLWVHFFTWLSFKDTSH